ncbi:ABC transporter permease [Ornithinimicrobium pratense]|uniref:ABC transporter permease n=1 Tax=Ornithinimicrobium pratense TaxID=2593973 RepID=A0A5J6V2T7_9MICO|nr:ABC transporter permease [Ornithinimicrobium pratense]QFG67472.1 ABC transporter permease [Ornithinimicrobium pratense]
MSTVTDPRNTPPASQASGQEGTTASATRSPWTLVLQREIAVKLKDRSFIWGTVLTLVFLIAALVLPSFFGGGAASYQVAVTGQPAAAVVEQAETTLQAEDEEASLTAETVADRAAAEQAVRDGDVDAALVGEPGAWELLSDGAPSLGLDSVLSDAVRTQALTERAEAAGLSVEDLTAGSVLIPVDLSESEDGMPGFMQFILGFVFAILFYMAALTFGLQIANSVVEEKQSRIVEILAAMIPVRQLLLGKVLGNTILAFGQIALIVVVALVAMPLTGFDVALPGIAEALLWYLPFFVLGFLALACIWAAAGALASRTEDVQSTSMPLTMFLVVIFILALNSSGTLREVLSFVPVASTFVMPMRIVEGDTALWEPLLALALVALFCAGSIWLGAKLYERALLHTQGALTWRGALGRKD